MREELQIPNGKISWFSVISLENFYQKNEKFNRGEDIESQEN